MFSRVPACFAALVLVAPIAAAQQNPFKLPKADLKAVEISYEMAGDLKGTASTVMDGDRMMTRSTATGKFFGKTSTTDQWTLVTGDWMYSADLAQKRGSKLPNFMPVMAKEWDALDKDQKKRAWQNMQDMAEIMSRAFGGGPLATGEKGAKRVIAGESCEERKFGPFTVCSMEKAPQVALHTSGSLLCVRFEQTATSVKLGGPVPASAFEIPADVQFDTPKQMEKPDSMARGFLHYLASQELTDSLAKAKAELENAKAEAAKEQNMTPAQADSATQAATQSACETLKNFNVGQAIADAADAALKDMAEAMKAEAKNAATNKLKGLIKRPRIP